MVRRRRSATFVDQQLKAIVGLEIAVERVEGKVKLSQNRSEDDRAGVVAGLRATGHSRDAECRGGDGALPPTDLGRGRVTPLDGARRLAR